MSWKHSGQGKGAGLTDANFLPRKRQQEIELLLFLKA